MTSLVPTVSSFIICWVPTDTRHCYVERRVHKGEALCLPSESSEVASQSFPGCTEEKCVPNSFHKGVLFKAIALQWTWEHKIKFKQAPSELGWEQERQEIWIISLSHTVSATPKVNLVLSPPFSPSCCHSQPGFTYPSWYGSNIAIPAPTLSNLSTHILL